MLELAARAVAPRDTSVGNSQKTARAADLAHTA